MNKVETKIAASADSNRFEMLTPAWFAHSASNGRWRFPEHLRRLDHALAECASGRIRRLIVNMPPRHGKSEFVSKYFPAWYLIRNPEKRIILTGYSAKFAESWGRSVRDLITAMGKRYGVEISKSNSSAGNFSIEGHSGGMIAVGAGGSITGKGADLLIIDDPVKNDKEAHSKRRRESIFEWFQATAFTRLEPCGTIIIVMTRWHEDDLCGRLLSGEKVGTSDKIDVTVLERVGQWHILRMPALLSGAEGNSEALWPERFSAEKLQQIRKSIGEYWFSALYQQCPSVPSGNIFKRCNARYFLSDGKTVSIGERLHSIEELRVYATIDLAASTKEKSDYTVAVVFGLTRRTEVLLLEVIREKIEGAEHLAFVKAIHDRFRPVLIGIEAVQYQISLVQQAMRSGLPVKELRADRDKISRALPMAARMESGNVYFKENAPWLHDFEEELFSFPSAPHDDQVDAFSYISSIISFTGHSLPASAGLRNRISNGF